MLKTFKRGTTVLMAALSLAACARLNDATAPSTSSLRFIQPDTTKKYTNLDNLVIDLLRIGQGQAMLQYFADSTLGATQPGTGDFSLNYNQTPLAVGNHVLRGYVLENAAKTDSASLPLRIRQEPIPICTSTLNSPFVGQQYTVNAGRQDPDTAGVDSYTLRRNDGQFTQTGAAPLQLTRAENSPMTLTYFCDIIRNGRTHTASVLVNVVQPQAPTKNPQTRDWILNQKANVADTVVSDPANPSTITATLDGAALPVTGNIVRQNPLMTQRGVNIKQIVWTPTYGSPVTFTDTMMVRQPPAPQCVVPTTAARNSTFYFPCKGNDPDNALQFNSPAKYLFYVGDSLVPYDRADSIRTAATTVIKPFSVQGPGTYSLRVDLIVPLPAFIRDIVTGGILQTEVAVTQRYTINVP